MPRSIAMPLVYNYLDMWSGHITAEDRAALDADAITARSLVVIKYDAGWFVCTPHEDVFDESALDEAGKTYTKAMIKIMLAAQENDCCFVRFDTDGLKYDDLEDHSQ